MRSFRGSSDPPTAPEPIGRNRRGGAYPVRAPHTAVTPIQRWESRSPSRAQARAEIAAGTYRHREQQQQQQRRRPRRRRGQVGAGRPGRRGTRALRGAHVGRTSTRRRARTHVQESCVPRVITGFRRGNAPAMADPPAYSRGRIQAFGRRYRHTRCVPVTPLVSTPIKHPLVKETGGRARGARGPP